ncbi:MAG: hypothetical protein AB1673_14015 [Actinomycetota bacterium]
MRADLVALTDGSLAALANRGIVKRAAREVAEGLGPELAETEGAVTATFPDGTTVLLPVGKTLGQGRCSCPASGVCRHQVMLAMAYRQRLARAGDGEPAPARALARERTWSPAQFSDAELEAYVGSRLLAEARRAFRSGYRARVRRAGDGQAEPAAELATCTVRFLVPGELGYARVDAARGTRQDAVALAVWAFRKADELGLGGPVVDVEVGGPEAVTAGRHGLEALLALLADLLSDGVTGTGPEVATAIAQVRQALDGRNLRWPVDVLDDLTGQIEAYRSRSSGYEPRRAAEVVAEAIARHRCATGGGASSPAQVLGTEEAAETPLRLLRLTGLGARATGDDRSRSLEVYLAQPDAGVVLALRRRAEASGGTGGAPAPLASELGRRRAGGARLAALASANVVTESAVRAANRVVRFSESRVAKTSVTPSSGRWDELPEGILVPDLDAEAARLAGLAPSVVRARVVAESVRAVPVEALDDLYYVPGEQRLRATVSAPVGRAAVVFTHSAATPGAVDALARALAGEDGPVRFVAGHLRRRSGGIELEPTAVVTGSTVVVPAFAEAEPRAIEAAPVVVTGPMANAVDAALDVAADLLHRGLRNLPPSWWPRADHAARGLGAVGLTRAGAALATLADVARYRGPDCVERWADAYLRLLVTAEQL